MAQDWAALAAQLGGTEAGAAPDDRLDALAAALGGAPTLSGSGRVDARGHAEAGGELSQLREAFKRQDEAITESVPRQLAAAAGFAAGPGVLAGALASGGGSYLGHRLIGKSREDAAGEGASDALLAGGVGMLTKLPAGLKQLARRAVKGGLKVDRGYLEKMSTARKQGLMGAEDEVVDTVLDTRINPVTARGYDKLQGAIDDTAAARQAKIRSAPDEPVAKSGAAVNQKLNRRLMRELDATGEPGVEPTRDVMKRLAANPKYGANQPPGGAPQLSDLTPKELAKRVEADNALLRGKFGKEEAPGIEAIKDVRGLNARMLDRAAGTRGESQQLKKLIDLRNIANVARRRAEARDVVGITDLVSLSAGRPAVLGATTAMRPAVQTQLGLTLDKVRSMLPLPAHATRGEREAIIALLREWMGGQE